MWGKAGKSGKSGRDIAADPAPPGDPAELLAGLTAAPGEKFLEWLVCHLCRTLRVDWLFVWERCGGAAERVRTVAVSHKGEPAPGLEVPLAGTPCEAVYRHRSFAVTDGLAAAFPDSAFVRQVGARSFIGIDLRDEIGRPLGDIAAIHSGPIDDPERLFAAFESFRTRLTGELSMRLAMGEVREMLASPDDPHGDELCRNLAASFARLVQAKVGFVCELMPHAPTRRARTLGLVVDGKQREPLEFDLEGTPCDHVYDRDVVFHADGLRQSFPDDPMLAELGVVSYLGCVLRDGNGTPIGHVGVMHDSPLDERCATAPLFRIATERAAAELARRRAEGETLRIERQLFAAQKLESLGVLAGGIAHDFNNLLMGILGHASLVLADPRLEPAARDQLRAIETASRRAADLAQQMLAYSGRGSFDVKPRDLSELVEETIHLLRASLPKNVDFECSCPRGLPAVRIDATQIRQVVMNLVLNAAEAIGEGRGRVRVTTGRTATLADGEQVVLEVTDGGCGMDEATRARIFEPFFTTKAAGRGLGLAAVQGIVRGHRGVLEVTSAPGRGSSFRIRLPACAEPVARAAEAWPAAKSDRADGLILVIDDEEMVRNATTRMVDHLGYTVRSAADGRAGVAALVEGGEAIRLVLLDMAMPRLSGEETLRELRRVRADVRVVLMTGYSQREATQRMSGAGLAGLLQKPFGLRELERCLRDATKTTPARVPETESAAGE